MDRHIFHLPTKPGAFLHASVFLPPSPNAFTKGPDPTILVFLNGMMLSRAGWAPTVEHLVSLRSGSGDGSPSSSATEIPPILTFDRFGQGDSDPDPTDAAGSPYGHDMLSAVADLEELLAQAQSLLLPPPSPGSAGPDATATATATAPSPPNLVLVCNSIGCALARLYAAAHPGRVAAALLLDSMIANTDFVSEMPDPDALPGADDEAKERGLPAGVTVDGLRRARDAMRRRFHPDVPNRERLDRRNSAALLPRADAPVLVGPERGGRGADAEERGVRVVVVGHDPGTFAEQTEEVGAARWVVEQSHASRSWWPTSHRGTDVLTDGMCHLSRGQWPSPGQLPWPTRTRPGRRTTTA